MLINLFRIVLTINSTATFNITVLAVEKLIKVQMNAHSSTPIVACIKIIFPFRTGIHTSIVAFVVPASSLAITPGTMINAEIFAFNLK